MTSKVLILGAGGRFGRTAAEAFWNAGWTVRRFDRRTDDLATEARDVDVIVNAWNPPYDRWEAEVPALTSRVIEAARAGGATIILPGNVYVFGEDAPETFSHTTPHMARNTLGRVRVDLEEAYRRSGVRTIVLRAGDFIDTEASGNWFDKVMIAKLDRGVFVYPGNPDIPHAWAWLPDMARAAVMLAERRGELGRFEDVPFPGYTLTGREMRRLVSGALGREVALKRMSYLPLRLAAPFWKMGRHLLEMSYLWRKPHHLDGARFAELLPGFDHTPPETALAVALGAVEVDPDKAVAGYAIAQNDI